MSFSSKVLGDYPQYVKNLMLVKMAAAKANVLVNALSEAVADAIMNSCQYAIDTYDAQQYPVDVCHGGGGIGINMNINEVISALASDRSGLVIDPIVHVNKSQSTADVCHTAIRLTLGSLLDDLLDVLSVCGEAFRDKQREFTGIATISRTCMMDAMEIDLGHRFSGYADVVFRRREAILLHRQRMFTVNLGGTVIGSGEGAVPGYREVVIETLRELYGEELVYPVNFYDTAQNMDELVALAQSLSNLSQVLVKVSQDLRFLSSGPEAGIGELKLPKTQSGSSFFPGKVNPVLPEMMMQCAFLVQGLTRSVESSQMHGDTDLNVFEEFAGILVMDQIQCLQKAIHLLTSYALVGISVDTERCASHANSLVPMVTRLANQHGYGKVSNVIQDAAYKAIPVKQALIDAF